MKCDDFGTDCCDNAHPRHFFLSMLAFVLMALIIGAVVVGVLAFFAAPAKSAEVYQYTTDTGSIAFTDDAKNIPAKFQSSVRERTWLEVNAATDKKWTIAEPAVGEPPARTVEALPEEPNPNLTDILCGQPTVVEQRYVQQGPYFRQMSFAFDPCGNLTSVSFNPPRINR